VLGRARRLGRSGSVLAGVTLPERTWKNVGRGDSSGGVCAGVVHKGVVGFVMYPFTVTMGPRSLAFALQMSLPFRED
jgi:hypothetical protein